ncbi:MAG: hypothetical protein [Bacteriophage sp.]|nr:MAG: hypothetical protein [Bacteriophage sp.]
MFKNFVIGILFLLLLLKMMNGFGLVKIVFIRISVKILYLKNLMVLFMIYMLLVKSLLVLIVLIPKFGKRIIKVLLGMVGYLNIKIIFLQVVILIDVALDGLT